MTSVGGKRLFKLKAREERGRENGSRGGEGRREGSEEEPGAGDSLGKGLALKWN